MTERDADYTYHLAMGSHALAQRLTQMETSAARKERKERVLARKTELLVATYPDDLGGLEPTVQFSALPSRLGQHEDVDTRRTLLIDLTFSDPFAPYELKFERGDMDTALGEVARTIGLSAADIKAIRSTQAAALRAHIFTKGVKVTAAGVGAAVVLGAGAFFIAGPIGAVIGGYAGLSGAAATSAGLAMLGGGSLAAGGLGMAGGIAVVTGIGAAAGFAGISGAALMMELGAARSRAELIKLQVAYKEVLLHNQADTAKAQLVVKDLGGQLDELREQLEVERTLNDRNADRLKELEKTVEAVERSLGWMKKQRAA
jgi:hypothetical protein